MRVLKISIVLVLAVLSSGCLVLTLQPVYDENSLEVDDGLVGEWQARERPVKVVVERGEWKSYKINYTERSTSYTLAGYLTRVGDSLFADLTPLHGVEDVPLMIPAHAVVRLVRTGDTLKVTGIDYDWFVGAMRGRKIGPLDAALDARQNALVTSKTEIVRAWLLGHMKTATGFSEPVEFARTR